MPKGTSDTDPRCLISLKIDGQSVARQYVKVDDDTSAHFFPSITTMQHLATGQDVTIEFEGHDGTFLVDAGGYKHNRWSGSYLGPGTPALPECQFVGQTFEYPGSCRLYYLCLSDGTIGTMSCCPGIYSPSAKACISEEEGDVDFLCNASDVCV